MGTFAETENHRLPSSVGQRWPIKENKLQFSVSRLQQTNGSLPFQFVNEETNESYFFANGLSDQTDLPIYV